MREGASWGGYMHDGRHEKKEKLESERKYDNEVITEKTKTNYK